jgi:aminoglycoside phosphotransferase (APT) family kinase protein
MAADEHDDQPLTGGIANAGAVVRRGDLVLRPTGPHTATVQRFLAELRAAGFDGAPQPRGMTDDGRERLGFIPGDVAVPPYPAWAQTDEALASIARLMRRLHDTAARIGVPDGRWNRELADPAGAGGPIVCHNDVCLENVVFRDGEAIGLIDFDFAAPGRPVHDIVQLARMCVPLDDDVSAARLGWAPADRPGRLRLVCDAYGLGAVARRELLGLVSKSFDLAAEFVRRRVEAGDAAFVERLDRLGGPERFERRHRWWRSRHEELARALR